MELKENLKRLLCPHTTLGPFENSRPQVSARSEEILGEGTDVRGPTRILQAVEFCKTGLEIVRNDALALNL